MRICIVKLAQTKATRTSQPVHNQLKTMKIDQANPDSRYVQIQQLQASIAKVTVCKKQ